MWEEPPPLTLGSPETSRELWAGSCWALNATVIMSWARQVRSLCQSRQAAQPPDRGSSGHTCWQGLTQGPLCSH